MCPRWTGFSVATAATTILSGFAINGSSGPALTAGSIGSDPYLGTRANKLSHLALETGIHRLEHLRGDGRVMRSGVFDMRNAAQGNNEQGHKANDRDRN